MTACNGLLAKLWTARSSACRRCIHVAGTNGKGSTCALLRAMGEAAGLRVHVFTSPHLVRFNERFRLAGRLVTDIELADAMETIERVNDGAAITVFEVITATAFQLFAAHPADLCVLEVGLGGRGDATNVIEAPAACAITSISIDHRELLGDTLAAIAAEKAGIMKPGIPVVTGAQPPQALAVLHTMAAERGATLLARGDAWHIAHHAGGLRFTDAAGTVDAPMPALPGPHQIDNAGIAIAVLRAAGLASPAAYPDAAPLRDALRLASRWRKPEFAFWALPVAAYFVFPSDLALLSQIAITALFVISLDLILGYAASSRSATPRSSGTGAYAAGLLAKAGWGDPLIGLAAAAAVAALLGSSRAGSCCAAPT